jgi:hypothetical protein
MQDAEHDLIGYDRTRAGMKIRRLAKSGAPRFATLSRIEKLLPVISSDTGAALAELRPNLVQRNEVLAVMLAEVRVQ